MINTGLMSSISSEWETPNELFKELDDEFHFTLDVCANQENWKCWHHFTMEEDGLAMAWMNQMAWMNPPYGREIGKWVAKAYEEVQRWPLTEVVGLLPARTDTKWFHDYIYGKAETRFIKGRIKFVGGKSAAPFPSMIVIWRKSNAPH